LQILSQLSFINGLGKNPGKSECSVENIRPAMTTCSGAFLAGFLFLQIFFWAVMSAIPNKK